MRTISVAEIVHMHNFTCLYAAFITVPALSLLEKDQLNQK